MPLKVAEMTGVSMSWRYAMIDTNPPVCVQEYRDRLLIGGTVATREAVRDMLPLLAHFAEHGRLPEPTQEDAQ